MNTVLEKIAGELDGIATYCQKNTGDNDILSNYHGWSYPALTFSDLGELATRISTKIKSLKPEELSKELSVKLEALLKKITSFKGKTLSYMFNGNGGTAIPLYFILLSHCEDVLSGIKGWASLNALYLQQAEMQRILGKTKLRFNSIQNDCKDLEAKITNINEATEAADSLPVTMQSLKESLSYIKQEENAAKSNSTKIKEIQENCQNAEKKLKEMEEKAADILNQASTAYSSATARGLSGAFYQRARKLQLTMFLWVSGLAAALFLTVLLGKSRFEQLSTILTNANTPWYVILIQILMAFIGIGAPIWFAWLASKQITYLFKISEDYSFKASVAKAYEGFRLEVQKYDHKFSERLLLTAMEMLNEEPLRFVDKKNHTTPIAELADSALSAAPLKRKKSYPNNSIDSQNLKKEESTISNSEDAR